MSFKFIFRLLFSSFQLYKVSFSLTSKGRIIKNKILLCKITTLPNTRNEKIYEKTN